MTSEEFSEACERAEQAGRRVLRFALPIFWLTLAAYVIMRLGLAL